MRPHLSPEYMLTGIIFTIMLTLSYIPQTLGLDPKYFSLLLLVLLTLAYGHILKVQRLGICQGILRQQLHNGAIGERSFRRLYSRNLNASWVLKGTAMLAAGLGLGTGIEDGFLEERKGDGMEVGLELGDDEVTVVEEDGAE
jgi:hypothetical protein